MGLGQTEVARVTNIESAHTLGNSSFNPSLPGILLSEVIRFFTFASLEQGFVKWLWADGDPTPGGT